MGAEHRLEWIIVRGGDMKRLATGLALSGGTAKSVAHIGVIRALEENGIPIDYLAGTSGGAVVAVLYAAGRGAEELEAMAGGIRWGNIAGFTLPRLGLLSSDKIRKFIIDEIGDIEFSDLAIPVAVVASDLTTREKRIFREGKVAVACQASSSIPEFYTPVEIGGHILVDGGITEYVPISALASLGEMFTIGVNLGFEQGSSKKPRHLIEMIVQVTNFIAQQNAVVSERLADFMIHPDLGEFSSLDLNKASRIVRKAYRETIEIIPDLKAAIKAARGPARASNASKSRR
jgi:NTE family protein